MNHRSRWLPWLLCAPMLLVVLSVAFYPLLQTVLYSLTDARLGSTRPVHFVWFRNYYELLIDPRLHRALSLTFAFAAFTVVIEFAFGLVFALLMNASFRGRGLIRAAVLVPWAIPTVMSTQIWKWMYHDVFGVVNDVGMRIGLLHEPVAWVADPGVLFFSICAVDIWKTTPFIALMLLAGLQVIPQDIYEAADLDGASRWNQFKTLTLPLLKPALVVTLIFRTLDALRAFDIFYVMVGNRPRFQTLAVLNQQLLVEFSRVGLGSALSVIIFALIALCVAIYMQTVGTKR